MMLSIQITKFKFHQYQLRAVSVGGRGGGGSTLYMYNYYAEELTVLFSFQLRNKTLVQGIRDEEEEIMQIKVKLKVLPLKQKLNVDE